MWRLILGLVAVTLWADSWTERMGQGNLQSEQGRYREAIAQYQGALPLAELPRYRAVTLYRLGDTHSKLAEFVPAAKYLREALRLFEAEGDASRIAMTLSALGEIYRAQNRFDDALESDQHAYAALKAADLAETREAGIVAGITGAVLVEKRDLVGAERWLNQAIGILEKTGANDPELAANLNNLSTVKFARRQFAESEVLLTRALAIREAHFGPEHPEVASTLLNVASVQLEQGRYREAAETCRRSIAMMRQYFPVNHPDAIRGEMELALIAHRGGDVAGAVAELEQALAEIESAPPRISGPYVQIVTLYARYLHDGGEGQKSRRYEAEAKQLLERYRKSGQEQTVSVAELAATGLR